MRRRPARSPRTRAGDRPWPHRRRTRRALQAGSTRRWPRAAPGRRFPRRARRPAQGSRERRRASRQRGGPSPLHPEWWRSSVAARLPRRPCRAWRCPGIRRPASRSRSGSPQRSSPGAHYGDMTSHRRAGRRGPPDAAALVRVLEELEVRAVSARSRRMTAGWRGAAWAVGSAANKLTAVEEASSATIPKSDAMATPPVSSAGDARPAGVATPRAVDARPWQHGSKKVRPMSIRPIPFDAQVGGRISPQTRGETAPLTRRERP